MLTESEDDLQAAMAKKTRQYIRKSTASGITISRVTKREELDACLEMYEQTSVRAGFNLHSLDYYRDVFEQMGDHSPIFIAYEQGRPIAFLWLALSESTAFELYGGMTERGQELRANYALKWHVIQKTRDWGVLKYDFGGLIAGGVSVFKQGWAAEETVLAGTFDTPLSPLYGIWTKALPIAKKIAQKFKL